jgi:hypothetical protein
MPVILDTVVDYENKLVDFVKNAQEPVTDAVRKVVDFADDRLPEVTYPSQLATPLEVLDTQLTFARQLLEANGQLAKSVLITVAPVAGYTVPAKLRNTKSTKTAA